MKTIKCEYNDDGILIPGVLISFLWMKKFYPNDKSCGWTSQKITNKNKHLIVCESMKGK